jgi:subtilase family serine protease
MPTQKIGLIIGLLCALVNLPIHAAKDPNLAKKARYIHTIKPHTSSDAPSGYVPSDIANAYGFSNITEQGAGQIIAIIDAYDNPNAEADLGVFSQTFNLPSCTTDNGCFQKIYADGTAPATDVGWAFEISLDIQWAHAVAPLAHIMLVEAADDSTESLLEAISVAVQSGANVVSMSWGGDEFDSETQYDQYFSASGVTFLASSGDSGTGVLWPAVSGNVIAVGGTTLNVDQNGNYVSEEAWSGSGGGISAYVSLPAYQQNFAVMDNPNQMRGIPDVSIVADPDTGLSVYNSFGNDGWAVVGGTSAAAPQWAGFIALVNSATQSPLASMNTLLYEAATQAYATDYNDITSGSNGTCGDICNAQTGYDYVTGLGSPQAANLLSTLISENSEVVAK